MNGSFDSSAVTALRSIAKARQVLEEVVTSSESFDYHKAKQGLKELQKIIRQLSREEVRLRKGPAELPTASGQILAFPPLTASPEPMDIP